MYVAEICALKIRDSVDSDHFVYRIKKDVGNKVSTPRATRLPAGIARPLVELQSNVRHGRGTVVPA